MSVHRYPGGPALSAFARRRLNSSLQEQGLRRDAVAQAHFLYFVELERSLSAVRKESLLRLLEAEEGEDSSEEGATLYVVPRFGTISPWSTKATEILRDCGLTEVIRVERGVRYQLHCNVDTQQGQALLFDRMTQTLLTSETALEGMFEHAEPRSLECIGEETTSREALAEANRRYGLALSGEDIEYLAGACAGLQRRLTDAELMMFAQVNSEHCRHKIFRGRWKKKGEMLADSLFDMIRSTHEASPGGTLSAYSDNAAVLEMGEYGRWGVDPESGFWQSTPDSHGLVIKVETHNHPTGISPYPGAATGSGGEIRDESACGRGGRPKAGLCGFAVADLNIPGWARPWEDPERTAPENMAGAFEIMTAGPVGAASFNNEFGRPNLLGFFRTLEKKVETLSGCRTFGYHKPVMLAGGLGSIRARHVEKQEIPDGSPILVLGGPAMLIGLGGGAASSLHTGAQGAELDYASVQRSNPEMQRRAQEVIEQCTALGDDNPILSIHDVGAGGLSNALPELVSSPPGGATLELREIPLADHGLSPREIWCNEAQERYVLAVRADALKVLTELCARERCPCAVLGHATGDGQLRLTDRLLEDSPVDVSLSFLFGEAGEKELDLVDVRPPEAPLDITGMELEEALARVLTLPSVASKSFLVTIGDRTVGGLSVRDPMVGPWQVPVADAAVTATDFEGIQGEAMTLGERPLLALHRPDASARMAVAEALTNLACVRVRSRDQVRLSANWMAAAADPEQLAGLRSAVSAITREFCPALGISIPVGKDSLSMQSAWEGGASQAPVTLVASAFAPVADVRRHVTPQLHPDAAGRILVLRLDRSMRLGCSALAQVYGRTGTDVPDCEEAARLRLLFDLVQDLLEQGRLLAYHDCSDGGLIACLCECAFAAHTGLDLSLPVPPEQALRYLFHEEIGAVIQVHEEQVEGVLEQVAAAGLTADVLGSATAGEDLVLRCGEETLLRHRLPDLQKSWSRVGFEIARRRDHEECADSEYEQSGIWGASPLQPKITCPPQVPGILTGARPVIAILREQGVNGQAEMAAAFARAGFRCRDVHMTDLQREPGLLDDAKGLAACGGFSYGDVLGAGRGWANNIIYNNALSDIFQKYFERSDSFALGVCNGCQMLSWLQDLIPGAQGWPSFLRNRSEQFEARLCRVEVVDSPSILLQGMEGSLLPVAVAHGEGRVTDGDALERCRERVCLRYVDADGQPTETYPANPNGSLRGTTGLTSEDGRVTILMPHPERVFRSFQYSWSPEDWGEDGPWLRMFQNARQWVG